jgi:hypothetical protein
MKGGIKMIDNGIFRTFIRAFFLTTILYMFSHQVVAAGPQPQAGNCINAAAERTRTIKALPAKDYLQTLDGQNVLLNSFFSTCQSMFPWCGIFEKFYYWPNEIREVVSDTPNGQIKHRIRCYYNCLSTYCPKTCDPLKTHGDVAEFYDGKGAFMGLAVYMGYGKYCSLPYDGYQKTR